MMDLFNTPTKTKTDIIYEALKRGEKLTVGVALNKYGVYALSQEAGRVEKKYGIILERGWQTTSPGVKVRLYSMKVEGESLMWQ